MTKQIVAQRDDIRATYPSEKMVVITTVEYKGETLTVRGVPEAQAIVRTDLGSSNAVRKLKACGYVRRPQGSAGSPLALVSLDDAEEALNAARGGVGRAIRDALRDTARDWRQRHQATAEVGQSAETFMQALAEIDEQIMDLDKRDSRCYDSIRSYIQAIEANSIRREALIAARGRVALGHMEAVAREEQRLGDRHRALVEGSERMALALGQEKAIEQHAVEMDGIQWSMTQMAQRVGTTESRCWEALAAQGLAERRTVYSSRTGQVVEHDVWMPTERGEAAGITRVGTRMTTVGGHGRYAGQRIEVPAPGIMTRRGAATLLDALHMTGCSKSLVQHHAVINRQHTEEFLAQRQRVLDDMPWSLLDDGVAEIESPAEAIVTQALAEAGVSRLAPLT